MINVKYRDNSTVSNTGMSVPGSNNSAATAEHTEKNLVQGI